MLHVHSALESLAVPEPSEFRRGALPPHGPLGFSCGRLGAVTRYEIAQAVASQVHAFAHRLPPVRRLWDHEDSRMYLFDAASLAMTCYASSSPDAKS